MILPETEGEHDMTAIQVVIHGTKPGILCHKSRLPCSHQYSKVSRERLRTPMPNGRLQIRKSALQHPSVARKQASCHRCKRSDLKRVSSAGEKPASTSKID